GYPIDQCRAPHLHRAAASFLAGAFPFLCLDELQSSWRCAARCPGSASSTDAAVVQSMETTMQKPQTKNYPTCPIHLHSLFISVTFLILPPSSRTSIDF